MIIKTLLVNRLLRNVKKRFKEIYKTDKYGAYFIDIKNLVMVIVFKNEADHDSYIDNGLVDTISNFIKQEFNKKIDDIIPKTIFVSDDYIQRNFNGNYWMYYKSL
ncbi:MAG: hypothetical protein PF513_01315 [Tenericutes bacterium]|jgi:hypothetical protein|nr:hypothetical protein [Mycoplasmatota bacterium]